jgi:hypothetical protein
VGLSSVNPESVAPVLPTHHNLALSEADMKAELVDGVLPEMPMKVELPTPMCGTALPPPTDEQFTPRHMH